MRYTATTPEGRKKEREILRRAMDAGAITPEEVQSGAVYVEGGEIVRADAQKQGGRTNGRKAPQTAKRTGKGVGSKPTRETPQRAPRKTPDATGQEDARQDAPETVRQDNPETAQGIIDSTPERVEGETVKVKDTRPTLEEICTMCARALDDYTAQAGVEDWRKEELLRWRGACEYIGRTVFGPVDILRDTERRGPAGQGGSSNYNAYDYRLLNNLFSYFAELCHRYGKPMLQYDFFAFCGISKSTSRQFAERLSPASKSLFKRTFEQQHADLTAKAIQGGGVTLIATLNHVHGWDGSRQEERTENAQVLSTSELLALADKARKVD